MTLLVVLMATAVVPAIADYGHAFCTAKHHGCGEGPLIKSCCCGDQDSASNQNARIQAKVRLSRDVAPVSVIFVADVIPQDNDALLAAKASPPRPPTVDRPTLFASLLI
jgi:hypothetical protein